jgi:2-polyprenyl-3-methyl-5-hydroxy-6-metoxy-1,4-benzoquinol methylase
MKTLSETQMLVHACIACQSLIDSKAVREVHTFVPGFNGGFIRCKACGTEVVAPAVDTDRLYASRDTSTNYPKSRGLIVSIKKFLLTRVADRLLGNHRLDCSVLDFGCGGGELANAICSMGFADTCASDVQVNRPPTLASAVRYVPVSELNHTYAYDVILMRHVLEHLPNPVSVLKQLRSSLKPGGLIIVEVPSAASTWKRLMGTLWTGYFYPYHIAVFSEVGLRHIFSRSGLDVVSVKRVEPPIFGVFLMALGVPRGAARILSAVLYPVQWTVSKFTRASEALLFVVRV